MGIFKALANSWKAADTAGKINIVLDILCGFGAGAVSGKLMKKMAPEMNIIERTCASIAMCGIGMAAGEVAAKAYEPYTKAIGNIVDAAKTKEKKEDSEDGKYTRY